MHFSHSWTRSCFFALLAGYELEEASDEEDEAANSGPSDSDGDNNDSESLTFADASPAHTTVQLPCKKADPFASTASQKELSIGDASGSAASDDDEDDTGMPLTDVSEAPGISEDADQPAFSGRLSTRDDTNLKKPNTKDLKATGVARAAARLLDQDDPDGGLAILSVSAHCMMYYPACMLPALTSLTNLSTECYD